MQTSLYEKIASALTKQGYIVIDKALEPSLCEALFQDSLMQENNFKKAGISNQKALDTTQRRDAILWLENTNPIQNQFLSFSCELQDYLNRSLFLGLKYYEAHYAIYKEGDFYKKHFDSFKNSKNRVVTTVYYLNENWNEDDGGELLVYDKNDTLLETVLPKANRLVVFLSEEFPHEVKPAKKQRHSIAGWFRIDKFIL